MTHTVPVFVKVSGLPIGDDKDVTGVYKAQINAAQTDAQRADTAIALVKETIIVDHPESVCYSTYDHSGKRLIPLGDEPFCVEDGSHVDGRVYDTSKLPSALN